MVKSQTEYVTVTKLNSELNIDLSRTSGPPGDVIIGGYLWKAGTTHAIPNEEVEVYVNGAYEASAFTNIYGRYALTIDFPAGSYSIFTSWDGNATYYQDASPPVVAVYGKIQADITINVSPSSGAPPVAVTITGRLSRSDTTGGLGAKTVDLYRNAIKIDSRTTKTSTPLGVYEFHDTISAAGSHSYYVKFEGDDQYEGCEEEEPLPCTMCGRPISVGLPGSEVECETCHSVFETVIV